MEAIHKYAQGNCTNVYAIAIEDPPLVGNAQTHAKLQRVVAWIEMDSYLRWPSASIHLYVPTEWKKMAIADGHAGKDAIRKAVAKRKASLRKVKDQDAIDAAGIGMALQKELLDSGVTLSHSFSSP
jgi:Holliday junction resolvasome RuvABC endonuclease subunit